MDHDSQELIRYQTICFMFKLMNLMQICGLLNITVYHAKFRGEYVLLAILIKVCNNLFYLWFLKVVVAGIFDHTQ